MIRFKQKNFFLQFAGMAAMTALPMMQASAQGKEAKEQAEQSAAQMEKQNELIKGLISELKNNNRDYNKGNKNKYMDKSKMNSENENLNDII